MISWDLNFNKIKPLIEEAILSKNKIIYIFILKVAKNS